MAALVRHRQSHLAVQPQLALAGAADDAHALAGAVKLQDVQDLVLNLCDLHQATEMTDELALLPRRHRRRPDARYTLPEAGMLSARLDKRSWACQV